MFDIMKALMLTPTPWGWGIPTLYTGRPGPGKTSIARALGESFGCETMVLSPGEMGEAMFGAVPAIVDNRIDYPAPRYVDRFANGGLLIVDELRASPQVTRPALLGCILDRRIGGHQFPKTVSVIALSNSAEDSPNGAPLDPAVANRFVHVAWALPSVTDWLPVLDAQVCDSVGIVAEKRDNLGDARAAVMDAWPMPAAAATAAIGNVLRKAPQLFHKMPESGMCDGPWPSPRSWVLAGLVAATAKVHGLGVTWRDRLLEGAVGAEAANEYAVMLDRSQDLPDIMGYISGKVKWNPDPARPDVTIAVVEAMVGAATEKNLGNVFERLLDIEPAATQPVVMAFARLSEKLPDQKGVDRSLLKRVVGVIRKKVST